MPKLSIRHFLFLTLSVIGGILAYYLFQWESSVTFKHLSSYPEAYPPLHQARPYLLASLALLPAIASLIYCSAGILDRYLVKKFLGVFFLALTGFLLIWLLLELESRTNTLKRAGFGIGEMAMYFIVQLPYILTMMTPFVLLISCLFTLSQLSTHREVIAMIQTGRGFFRLVSPLMILGILISLAVSILNYHWVSWGSMYKEGMLDAAKHDTFTRAKNIVFSHPETKRLWYIGLFPNDHFEGEALKNIEITFPSESATPEKRWRIDEASWDHNTGDWHLKGIQEILLEGQPIPKILPKADQRTIKDWVETPSQLIATGLPANSLGVPQLQDSLQSNAAEYWIDRQPYLTQLHSRLAKPWTSLVAILLAAPLGVVFSRRGAFGGVITALVLCLCLFFFDEIFVTMGVSGYMNPIIAAWGVNIIFTLIALVLIQRRLSGQPIYQSIKNLFS